MSFHCFNKNGYRIRNQREKIHRVTCRKKMFRHFWKNMSNHPDIIPKLNYPRMTPEWPPRWPQDDLKMSPKWPKMIPTIIPFIIHHYSPSSFIIIHPHASLFIYHHPSPPFTIIFRRVQGSPFNFYFIFLNRMNAILGNWFSFRLGLGHVQMNTNSRELRSFGL